MAWARLFLLVTLLGLALPAPAQDSARLFVFGNDSLHRNDAPPETSVMVWLGRLAVAAGQDLAADGTSGEVGGFLRDLPPLPGWQAEGVAPAWDATALAFRRAGFDTVLIAGPADAAQTARLVDWAANQARGARFLLWQATGDRAEGDAWAAAVSAARPDDAVSLVPAGPILDTLTVDAAAPEAQALLLAWVLHGALWSEPPPQLDPGILPPGLGSQAELIAALWQAQTGAVLPAAPAPLPEGDMGLADPSLAMGLAGIADWSTQMPFVDVMKTARPWVGHTATQWGVWDAARLQAGGYLDAQGWPLAIPPELARVEALMLTDMPPGAHGLAGRYRVTWEGTGQVGVSGLARDVTTAPGEIWFSYSPGPGLVGVTISATDPADPVRNIVVVPERFIPLHEVGAVFNPDWLAVVGDLRMVRFMDWMVTNHSPQATWADRPRPDDFTYWWRGVPVEVMVRLANEIGADPWFTLPHMADDAYVTAFATHVRDHLDPRLRVHAEWSNEVWNFIFGQAQWALTQAEARWGPDTGDGWIQIAGERAAQVAELWAQVFAGQADRLVRVVGVHSGWQGLEVPLLDAPRVVAEGGQPPGLAFDALAVTGYFGHSIGSEEFAPTLRDWIAAGEASERLTALMVAEDLPGIARDVFGYFRQVADQRGLDLLMYEGGTHITGQGAVIEDQALTDALIAYSYSPEMAGLYAQLLADWAQVGDGPFNAFVDVATPSRWGSWGALRHLDDVNPRAATLAAHNAQPPVWQDDRAPGTFLQGVLRQGSPAADRLEGTAEEDVLLGLAGDDVLVAGPGDRLHGGPGRDVALLPGSLNDWALTPETPGRLRLDGPGGPVWIAGVEALAAADRPDDLMEVEQ